jgi:hypothetical protein
LAKSASATHVGLRSQAAGMGIVPMGKIEASIEEKERELGSRTLPPGWAAPDTAHSSQSPAPLVTNPVRAHGFAHLSFLSFGELHRHW